MYVFFHNGKELIKLDKDDINISERSNGNQDIRISVVFDSLPQNVVIDESNKTTLKDEYLLNKEGDLEVVKVFKMHQQRTRVLSYQLKRIIRQIRIVMTYYPRNKQNYKNS